MTPLHLAVISGFIENRPLKHCEEASDQRSRQEREGIFYLPQDKLNKTAYQIAIDNDYVYITKMLVFMIW